MHLQYKLPFLLIFLLSACNAGTNSLAQQPITDTGVLLIMNQANNGDAIAEYQLGDMYFTGTNFPQDKNKALELFIKSSDQNYDNADYTMGYLYANGIIVQQDNAKAAEYYLKAASQGHEESEYRIGQFYMEGKGVKKDLVKAYGWLKLVADLDTRSAALLTEVKNELSPSEKNDAETFYKNLYKKIEPIREKNETPN